MTDRAEIERLLQMTGRTLEGLTDQYSHYELMSAYDRCETKPWHMICHQSDVIELLVGALRDALDKPKQKPLTLTEANSYQDPLWIEFRVFESANGWRHGLLDALSWADLVYDDLQKIPEFMVHYRLWRHRPTDEEREAAAWEN